MYNIKLEGGTELVDFSKLSKAELNNILDMSLELENYRWCAFLKKYIENA